MREIHKHDYAGYQDNDSTEETTPSGGIIFEDQFVDVLAQRLIKRMQHDQLSLKQREVLLKYRFALAGISVLAFIPITLIVLSFFSQFWWMVLLTLLVIGVIFFNLNLLFNEPRHD